MLENVQQRQPSPSQHLAQTLPLPLPFSVVPTVETPIKIVVLVRVPNIAGQLPPVRLQKLNAKSLHGQKVITSVGGNTITCCKACMADAQCLQWGILRRCVVVTMRMLLLFVMHLNFICSLRYWSYSLS